MSRPRSRALLLLLLPMIAVLSCRDESAATGTDPVADALHGFFVERARDGFSGVVLLKRGDDRLLFEPYGTAGCSGEPLGREHVFLIGSIVKVFTRAAIYSLAADGKLDLDSSISGFFESVPPDKAAITIGMLASHSSGLDDTIGDNGEPVAYSPDWDYLPVTREQIIDRGLRSKLVFKPGTDRRYSNLGFSLLAAIIELAAEEPYENYVARKIFAPLGMARTGYRRPDWSSSRMAHGCLGGELWQSPNVAGRWMRDGPSWNLRGNGGMLGTVNDLERWLDGLASAEFMPEPEMSRFIDDVSGTSRSFSERATVAAGGNGIVNAYYIWLIDSNIRLIMVSNHSDHQVESYLDVIFPMLKSLQSGPSPAQRSD